MEILKEADQQATGGASKGVFERIKAVAKRLPWLLKPLTWFTVVLVALVVCGCTVGSPPAMATWIITNLVPPLVKRVIGMTFAFTVKSFACALMDRLHVSATVKQLVSTLTSILVILVTVNVDVPVVVGGVMGSGPVQALLAKMPVDAAATTTSVFESLLQRILPWLPNGAEFYRQIHHLLSLVAATITPPGTGAGGRTAHRRLKVRSRRARATDYGSQAVHAAFERVKAARSRQLQKVPASWALEDRKNA